MAELDRAGGTVQTGAVGKRRFRAPRARAVLFDTSSKRCSQSREDGYLPATATPLRRFAHGPGICKVDWALSGPVPWAASVCRRAGTVHVGGSFAEVAASEADVASGRHSDRPYCLVVQPGVVDPTRAPAGQGDALGLLPCARARTST